MYFHCVTLLRRSVDGRDYLFTKELSLVKRPTAGVTRLGWEGGFAIETGVRRSQENAKKRGAYPKSGARIVSLRYGFVALIFLS